MNQPTFSLNIADINGVAEVSFPNGQNTIDTENAEAVKNAFYMLVDSGKNNVLFRMDGITYISSMAIAILILLYKKLNAANGKLAICNANDFVREVFDKTNLTKTLRVSRSREDALKLLSSHN